MSDVYLNNVNSHNRGWGFYTIETYSTFDFFLFENKRHATCNHPMTAKEQSSSSVIEMMKYNTFESSINLNDVSEIRLMGIGRANLLDDGIQVVVLRNIVHVRW